MGHMALRIGASHYESAACLVWCSWVFCRWRDNVFICNVTQHDHLTEVLWKLLGGSSMRYGTTLVSLVTISTVIVGI